jgi:hypothetical protein
MVFASLSHDGTWQMDDRHVLMRYGRQGESSNSPHNASLTMHRLHSSVRRDQSASYRPPLTRVTKDLLDEYFETRPYLTRQAAATPNAQDRAQKAISGFAASNPKAASSMITTGIKSGAQSNPKSPWSSVLSNDKVGVPVGRLER